MLPDQPMQPGPGETPISYEVGLIVLGIGAAVAAVIVVKLLWEYWRRRPEDDDETHDEDNGGADAQRETERT